MREGTETIRMWSHPARDQGGGTGRRWAEDEDGGSRAVWRVEPEKHVHQKSVFSVQTKSLMS